MIRDTGTRSFIFESSICITSLKRKYIETKIIKKTINKLFDKYNPNKEEITPNELTLDIFLSLINLKIVKIITIP